MKTAKSEPRKPKVRSRDKFIPNGTKGSYHLRAEAKTETIEAVRRIVDGQVVKYDPAFHPVLLIDLFSEGLDVSAFCSECWIARTTFYQWLQSYTEFQAAYNVAKDRAQTFYERIAIEGLTSGNFNTSLWQVIMINRHDYTKERKVKLRGLDRAKSHNDRLQIANEKLARGDITISEAKGVADYIAAAAKIDETSRLAEAVENLESHVFDGNV